MADELSPTNPQQHEPSSVVSVVNSGKHLNIEIIPRDFKVYSVSEEEFDSIASFSNSVNLAFCTLFWGLSIAFWIALYTGGLNEKKQSLFVVLTLFSAIFGLYFLVRTIADHRRRRAIHSLKKGHFDNRS
jgi:ABC-type spermidine/putrescine transport system permease subunit I